MIYFETELSHSGIKGMRWGHRKYQNKDGSLTPAGRKRYLKNVKDGLDKKEYKQLKKELKNQKKYRTFDKAGITDEEVRDILYDRKSKKEVKEKNPYESYADISTKELKARVAREKLEREYTNMFAPDNVSDGQKRVQNLLEISIAASGVVKSASKLSKSYNKFKDSSDKNDKKQNDKKNNKKSKDKVDTYYDDKGKIAESVLNKLSKGERKNIQKELAEGSKKDKYKDMTQEEMLLQILKNTEGGGSKKNKNNNSNDGGGNNNSKKNKNNNDNNSDNNKKNDDSFDKLLKSLSDQNLKSMRNKRANKPRLDLSNMTDQELRDNMDRRRAEKEYHDMFGPKAKKTGHEKVMDMLNFAGSAVAVTATAVEVANVVKKMKG